ncbi:MAG: ABC transporter permease subunit [Actinomycetota bacterium]|nr:ABC transporter permease subunit [Actinomycetota bacterium]
MTTLSIEVKANKDQMRARRKRFGRSALRHLFLVIAASAFALPIYLALVISTHSAIDLLRGVPFAPGTKLISNLSSLFRGLPGTPRLGKMIFNSAIMALAITILKLGLSIPAAYAISFFRFRSRDLLFGLIFVTLMMPIEVRFFPTYAVTAKLGMLNSQFGLILPLVASATAVFVLRQFFMAFPIELADAARIDGIGPIRFLIKIVLPLSRPVLAALAVLEFVYGWNQYLWPLVISSSANSSTIVMGIKGLISAAESFAIPQWNLVMALAIVALIPPVIVVIAMQKWFIKGLTTGIS